MSHLNVITQIMVLLGAVCHILAGLRTEICEFILNTTVILVGLAMTNGASPQQTAYEPHQESTLKQLPTSLYTALGKFNIDGETTLYAACPSCSYTHKPRYDSVSTTASYPTHCLNRRAGVDSSYDCGTPLLEVRSGQARPVKPYLMASFREYLVKLLANKDTEELCDAICDRALSSLNNGEDQMNTAFDAEFMRTFKGPDQEKLFIDRGDKVRLAFAMHTNFFNPNGVSPHSNSASIGMVSLANLNLPEGIRYRAENLFLAGVIPGPKEPSEEQMNHFIRPLIEEFQVGWERGFHISQTATSPLYGRDVEVALALSVNDLPAARKVSRTVGHQSHSLCTRCTLYGFENLHNVDHSTWALHDVALLRRKASEWQDAETLAEQHAIYNMYCVRWSELWRLPYWDPPRMLVIDTMHCMLEGLVHHHCRRVLEIDTKRAKQNNPAPTAFSYSWLPYSSLIPSEYKVNIDTELEHITKIQRLLTHSFELADETESSGSLNEAQLLKKLLATNKQPLKFICFSLGLFDDNPATNETKKDHKKEDLANLLVDWVSCGVMLTDR